jgi:hypothetical protein
LEGYPKKVRIDHGFHGCDGSRQIDPKKSVASVRSVVYPIRKVPSRVDLLILKTLALGEMHDWGIAQRIQQVSQGVLNVNQGD